jgi:hypothetical protein
MYLFIRIAPWTLLKSEIKATRILGVLYEAKTSPYVEKESVRLQTIISDESIRMV